MFFVAGLVFQESGYFTSGNRIAGALLSQRHTPGYAWAHDQLQTYTSSSFSLSLVAVNSLICLCAFGLYMCTQCAKPC